MAGALVSSLVLAACSSTSDGPSDDDATKAVSASDKGMQRYYDQDITFGACAEFATNDGERKAFALDAWECGKLTVPLDYDRPDGKTAKIAVLRVAARGDAVGSLVVNPGGPGGTGTSFAVTLAAGNPKSPVTEKFDIVGFDPRGTGASTPALDCYDDSERDKDSTVIPFVAAGELYDKSQTQDLAERCAKRSGGEDVLKTSSTRNAARDLDVLREVLGDKKLTFLGDSWGTRLGAVYAEMYPEKVRAMILDGGIDPNMELVERAASQFKGFQNAFEALAEFCASGGDCPLGDDPANAGQRFQDLVRPLGDDPLPTGMSSADGSDRVLTPRSARDALIATLYAEDQWPALIAGLKQAEAGNGAGLLAIRDGFHQRSGDGSYNNFLENSRGFYCADEKRLSPKQATQVRTEIFELAPFMDVEQNGVETRDGCESWPAEPTLGFPYANDIKGLPELMVVSVTGDPATPYEDGANLAKTLGANLLTVEGFTHGVTLNRANPCIDDLASSYLIDLTAPPADHVQAVSTARLNGKVAVVTGGGAGIGRAISLRFASEGAHVFVCDIDGGAAKETAEIARGAGGRVSHAELDVSDEAGWLDALDQVQGSHGGFGVLVNNAGRPYRRALAESSWQDWQELMSVNAGGTFLGMKHGSSAMAETGGGSIVNISSAAALVGVPAMTSYSAGKGAIRAMSRTVAMELAGQGVRVNSIYPTSVHTAMLESDARDTGVSVPEFVDGAGALSPLAGLAQPDDVASAALFLASDESRFVTGAELVVDGGATAGVG